MNDFIRSCRATPNPLGRSLLTSAFHLVGSFLLLTLVLVESLFNNSLTTHFGVIGSGCLEDAFQLAADVLLGARRVASTLLGPPL